MRWDCEKQGCFNHKKRPKIEAFADCFPRRISFGDVDAIVELNGHFLMMEWKSYAGDIPRGQGMMYRRLVRQKNWTVLIVAGDAETMVIDSLAAYWHNPETGQGEFTDWSVCNLEKLKCEIKKWADGAR